MVDSVAAAPDVKATSIADVFAAVRISGETLADFRKEWGRLDETEKQWYRDETAKGKATS